MSASDSCTTIGSLVDEYLIAKGYEGRQQYARLLNIAIRGLKEIHYDVTGATVWSGLALDEFGRACIPSNSIKIIALFMGGASGLVPIARGSQSGKNTLEASGNVQANYANNPDGYLYDNLDTYNTVARAWQSGQFVGGNYTGGGGNPYTYSVNEALNKLEFSSNTGHGVIIQYLADPNQVNGKYVVNPMVADAILQYIYYADNRFKSSVSEGAKAEMQRKYVNAKTFAKMRIITQSSGDLRDSRSRGISLTPK